MRDQQLLTKINYGMDTTGEKEKRTSKKNVDRGSKSSHDNKKFGTRPMEKQRGMTFGFRKTATAVIKPDRQKTFLIPSGIRTRVRRFLSLAAIATTLLQVQTIATYKFSHFDGGY